MATDAAADRLFATIDTDKNGSLTQEELLVFLLGAVNTLSKRRGAAFADGWGGERDATRVTRERDARGTPRSLSRARVMSPRDGMARARAVR